MYVSEFPMHNLHSTNPHICNKLVQLMSKSSMAQKTSGERATDGSEVVVCTQVLGDRTDGLDAWWKPCIAVIYITMVVLMEGSLHAHGVHLQSKMRVKGT